MTGAFRHRSQRALRAMGIALAAVASPVLAEGAPVAERSAYAHISCDRACLTSQMDRYLAAFRARDVKQLTISPDARFSENGVILTPGEGLWGSLTQLAPEGQLVAEPAAGQVAWFGHAEENGVPVYVSVRLKIASGTILESETIVVRPTGLPLPFGDPKKLVHYDSFSEILPPERRKPRERMIAVADAYFSTLELNDGHVFAPLAHDCKRVENGVVTTSAAFTAGSNAEGCDAQFKLGIFKINKRIRDRRYPLIDEERGVILATVTFDHANEFDEYRLTNGKMMKTFLKWPNSISIMEIFKIVDGQIVDIEAMFDYVPYGMPAPFKGGAK